RPALDVSGWAHRVSEVDFFDGHDYTQDPQQLLSRYGPEDVRPGIVPNGEGEWVYHNRETSIVYRGQPFFLSEFGGIKWVPQDQRGALDEKAWGYGESPETIDAFYERFEAMCQGLMQNPLHMGFCYTQLTDVFQEVNGIFTFDRTPKFDHERLRKTLHAKAAIEEGRD
ncbi:MAG: beta-galactosidase, partial [Planctomycetota bacterium]